MTDTPQDGKVHRVPIIFLAGPIKHWWTCWGSPEHAEYLDHRWRVRTYLIDGGYLTYAPWNAIKGSWDPRAQQINYAAILHCDALLWLTPTGIPDQETQHEVKIATHAGKIVAHVLPLIHELDLIQFLEESIGPGIPYESPLTDS